MVWLDKIYSYWFIMSEFGDNDLCVHDDMLERVTKFKYLQVSSLEKNLHVIGTIMLI